MRQHQQQKQDRLAMRLMAQTNRRQVSTPTLAAQKRQTGSSISRAFIAHTADNLLGSLAAGLPVLLPGQLPAPPKSTWAARLGPPLSIRQVAELIGCSPWTVRQKLMPSGLPHFRFGANGKLIFYEDQVIRWIESKQQGRMSIT